MEAQSVTNSQSEAVLSISWSIWLSHKIATQLTYVKHHLCKKQCVCVCEYIHVQELAKSKISTYCTLMLHTVCDKVTGRELLPQNKSGSPEEHLPSRQYTTTSVIERKGIVNNIFRSDGGEEVDPERHHEESVNNQTVWYVVVGV